MTSTRRMVERSLERMVLPILAALAVPAALLADAPKRVEEVYLTLEEALGEVLPGAARYEETRLLLDSDEKARIEQRIGRRLFERGFDVFRGLAANGSLEGYAVVTEEIGKYQPITFAVGVTPDSCVRDVEVMVYRESIGSEVRRNRFRSQFRGKTTSSPLRINRDVIHIAGATLSSRAVARGVKKVLHAVDECLVGPRRRAEVDWRPVELEESGEAVEVAGSVRRARYLMGTVLEVVCFGERERAEPAVRAALDEIARLEGLLSTYRPESELSRVNREASSRPVPVSADTIACVEAALAFARRTDGAFDPTLVAAGHERVEVDREARTIRFKGDGLQLDLGGIGKGFALDRAARVLERHGITSALLNFGGQVLALDAPPGERAWIVPLQDPRDPERSIGHYEAVRMSISTSAAYERGGHIVDPRTGEPAGRALSTTVCARSATDADALSTSLDVLGPEAAASLANAVGGAAVLVVPAGGGPLVRHEGPGAPRFELERP